MLLGTSAWGSTRCFLTWKVSGTPAKRLLFRLSPLTPRTDETECGLLPTMTASCAIGIRNTKYAQGGTPLNYAPILWPTMTACEWKGRGPNSKQQGLAEKVKLWPTPTASEDAAGLPGAKMQTMLGNHPELGKTRSSGALNPQWVEWLMGYPPNWTKL
jgi:hypothetical protein